MYSTSSTRFLASLLKSQHFILSRTRSSCQQSCYKFKHCCFHSSSINTYKHDRRRGRRNGDDHSMSRSSKMRSPYAVLKLKTSATTAEIKNSFRKLAKEYHPDLNPQLSPTISQAKMSELIHAYDQLMDDDFLGRVGDGRVALACEMFTLQELKMDRFHDVYPIRIRYEDNIGSSSSSGDNVDCNSTKNGATLSDVSTFHFIEHVAHPDDSVSDIKRQLQSLYQHDWGLGGRRLDRDNLATGWEIVSSGKRNDGENDQSLEVMSYHLFLHSYGIIDGDVIHAVIRKYDD